jgi:hypothetical protein
LDRWLGSSSAASCDEALQATIDNARTEFWRLGELLANIALNYPLSVPRLLNLWSNRRATHRLDCVYGLLGVSRHFGNELSIKPDYDKSVFEVCQEVTQHLIIKYKSLDNLWNRWRRDFRASPWAVNFATNMRWEHEWGSGRLDSMGADQDLALPYSFSEGHLRIHNASFYTHTGPAEFSEQELFRQPRVFEPWQQEIGDVIAVVDYTTRNATCVLLRADLEPRPLVDTVPAVKCSIDMAATEQLTQWYIEDLHNMYTTSKFEKWLLSLPRRDFTVI